MFTDLKNSVSVRWINSVHNYLRYNLETSSTVDDASLQFNKIQGLYSKDTLTDCTRQHVRILMKAL